MGFYYAHEKKKFDAEWEKTAAWYKSEGMSDEDIEKMRLFDWAEFCRQRSYENRTQPLPEEYFDDENGSTLFQKFEQLTVTVDSETFQSRYDWIEQISDTRLARKLKSLSADEIEMLTLIVFDRCKQEEAARKMAMSYRTFKYRLKKLKEFLK